MTQPIRTQLCRLGRLSPEGLICDLLDIHTKEFFSSVFEHVLQETFRASAVMSHQRRVSTVSQPTVKTALTQAQRLYPVT